MNDVGCSRDYQCPPNKLKLGKYATSIMEMWLAEWGEMSFFCEGLAPRLKIDFVLTAFEAALCLNLDVGGKHFMVVC